MSYVERCCDDNVPSVSPECLVHARLADSDAQAPRRAVFGSADHVGVVGLNGKSTLVRALVAAVP